MTVIERWKAFVTRQRKWPWIAAGLAVVLIGHLLEGVNVLSGLQHITESVKNGLHAVQPFAIADAFWQADRGHRGLWFCEPIDPGLGCGSVFGLANVGIASLLAVPRVGREIWHDGGWIAIILYGLTVLGIGLSIIGAWRDMDKPDNGFGKTLLMTAGMLALGPLFAGVVFWLLLQFLLLLTIVVGAVLSGIIWLIATFGAIYKVAMMFIEGIKTGDEIEENSSLLVGKEPPPKP
jgi:hypothetical protein